MCKCGSLEGVFSWYICCHLHHEKQETSGSFLWVKHWVKHGKASLSHQLFFMGWIPINANWKLLIALAKTTLQKSPYFLWDMTYSPASKIDDETCDVFMIFCHEYDRFQWATTYPLNRIISSMASMGNPMETMAFRNGKNEVFFCSKPDEGKISIYPLVN